MRLSIFDGENEVVKIMVEVESDIFTITPEIREDKFSDMKEPIRFIIGRYLTKYINREDDFKQNELEKNEQNIIDELRELSLREISYYNLCEGKSYYINISSK